MVTAFGRLKTAGLDDLERRHSDQSLVSGSLEENGQSYSSVVCAHNRRDAVGYRG